MVPNDKPTPPGKIIDGEKIQETFEDVRAQAAEALRNPQGPEAQKAKSFLERNKKVIVGGIVVVVVLRANKRKVAKATAKAVAKELKKVQTGSSHLPTMSEIIRDLRMTPEMAYISHGGELLHLLRDHDTVISIAGDFKNMNENQVWEYATKVLNGKSFRLKEIKP